MPYLTVLSSRPAEIEDVGEKIERQMLRAVGHSQEEMGYSVVINVGRGLGRATTSVEAALGRSYFFLTRADELD